MIDPAALAAMQQQQIMQQNLVALFARHLLADHEGAIDLIVTPDNSPVQWKITQDDADPTKITVACRLLTLEDAEGMAAQARAEAMKPKVVPIRRSLVAADGRPL